jgi:predicted nucleic acid-binding protein
MTLVVDASAVAAMLFDEADGATIRAHIRGERLTAPHLLDFELANICWKRVRRTPSEHAASLAMLAGLAHVKIDRVRVPPTDVADLALRTGLTAYDASYLWLALSRDLELVTLDNKLARVNEALRERFV